MRNSLLYTIWLPETNLRRVKINVYGLDAGEKGLKSTGRAVERGGKSIPGESGSQLAR